MILIDEAIGKNSLVKEIEKAKEYLLRSEESSVCIITIVPPEIGDITGAIAEFFELDIPEDADDDWIWDNNSWSEIDSQLDELLTELSGRISEHLDGFYLQFDTDKLESYCLTLCKDDEVYILQIDSRIPDLVQL